MLTQNLNSRKLTRPPSSNYGKKYDTELLIKTASQYARATVPHSLFLELSCPALHVLTASQCAPGSGLTPKDRIVADDVVAPPTVYAKSLQCRICRRRFRLIGPDVKELVG